MPKPIHMIVACSLNRVIGRDGGLPWSIPEDTAFFESKTRGHTVVVGRRSFEDWADAADGRDVIVITRRTDLTRPGVSVAPSLAAALIQAQDLRGDIYICGGQRIYEEALPLADRLHLTLVNAEVEGDTHFPPWQVRFQHEVSRRDSQAGKWSYSFLELIP
jgi:dihydrofolate reductase